MVSNEVVYDKIQQQWCKAKDIQDLTDFSLAKANEIMTEIKNDIRAEGKRTLKGVVPMARVIKYLDIDEDRVIALYKKTKKANQ